MPLFQMIALAAVSAIAAGPANPSRPADGAPSVRCELVLEASVEAAGRTRKTFTSRCQGLAPTQLHVSYGESETKTLAAAARSR